MLGMGVRDLVHSHSDNPINLASLMISRTEGTLLQKQAGFTSKGNSVHLFAHGNLRIIWIWKAFSNW